MDKKNTIIGVVLLIAAFGLFAWEAKRTADAAREKQEAERIAALAGPAPAPQSAQSSEESASATSESPLIDRTKEIISDAGDSIANAAKSAAGAVKDVFTEDEKTVMLENDYISVTFTNRGGAIASVALKQYAATQGSENPYIIGQGAPVPSLGLSLRSEGADVRAYAPTYRIVSQTSSSIVFSRQEGPLEVIRSYTLSSDTKGPAPYLIQHDTRFINESDSQVPLSSLLVNVGAAAPTKADPAGRNLNASFFDGENLEVEPASYFKGSRGFLGIGARSPVPSIEKDSPIVWAAVKNQFFTAIATPTEPARAIRLLPVAYKPEDLVDAPQVGVPTIDGISAAIEFDFGSIPAKGDKNLGISYYAGPKELTRIDKLGQHQDYVMGYPSGIFGWVGFISKAMFYALSGIQNVAVNWGLSIILLTLCVRAVFWPLTAKATQMSKKMAKLAGPMKEINERYKSKLDNPSLDPKEKQRIMLKKQGEIMDLFKTHKVNPMAGCLPILIQMPIFIALYYMLQSASELRFEHFLWIQDLSLPDTVAKIGPVPINPISLLMGISMFFQMRMTPMSPPTDETQALQQKMIKFMPFVFLLICYNFASGLVLYWTISNCVSITQQWVTNRKKEPEETPSAANGKVVDAQILTKKKKSR